MALLSPSTLCLSYQTMRPSILLTWHVKLRLEIITTVTIFPHLCERHDAHMGVPVHVAPQADAVVTQEGVQGQRDAAVCVLVSRLVFGPIRYGQVWSEDHGHQNELYEAHAAHKQLSPQCRYR